MVKHKLFLKVNLFVKKLKIKNMKILLRLISLFAILMFASCEPTRVYTTASYGSLKSYTEKQHYIDKKTTKTYISGDLSFGEHEQDGGEFNDTKTIAAFNIHRTTTGKFYNFYYGLGGAFGSYKFKKGLNGLIADGEKNNFYSVSLKSGINFTHSRPKVDWRFIGVEFSYLNEFGSYQNKLSYLLSQDAEAIIVNQKALINYQFYSEYAFKTVNNNAITVGFYLGDILNYKDTQMYSGTTSFSGITLGVRLKKYAFHAVFETGEGDIKSTKVGVTYNL